MGIVYAQKVLSYRPAVGGKTLEKKHSYLETNALGQTSETGPSNSGRIFG